MRVRHVNQRVAPGGGPHGYLHNLRQAVARHGSGDGIEIEVAEAWARPRGPSPAARARRFLLEDMPILRRIRFELRGEFALRFERAVGEWKIQYQGLERAAARALFECDLLFAHETFLAERLVQLCPREARQKLVLMTHAPTFYAHQLAGDVAPDENQAALVESRPVRELREQELEVMQAVRAVAWPSVSAQEGYRDWQALYDRGAARTAFVATGVPQPEARASREETRRQWQVEPDQRVALFMGRPHPHKGFDRFVDWADWTRRGGDRSWVFVFAGPKPKRSQRDLTALRRVGYQQDNGAAYLASDLAVFPNRYSYLDIGLLECLSLGATAATTATGGHKDVLGLCAAMPVIPEGGAAECWPALSAEAERARADPARDARYRSLWEERFSLRPFVLGHAAAARGILEETRA